MNYCAPRGIPYSEFMGRALVAGEPRWTQDDTLLAIEWQRWQSEICGGCGHPLSESLDEGNDYQARQLACFACEVKERAEKAASAKENADTSGKKITAVWVGRRPLFNSE